MEQEIKRIENIVLSSSHIYTSSHIVFKPFLLLLVLINKIFNLAQKTTTITITVTIKYVLTSVNHYVDKE